MMGLFELGVANPQSSTRNLKRWWGQALKVEKPVEEEQSRSRDRYHLPPAFPADRLGFPVFGFRVSGFGFRVSGSGLLPVLCDCVGVYIFLFWLY